MSQWAFIDACNATHWQCQSVYQASVQDIQLCQANCACMGKEQKSPSFLEDQQKVLAEWDRKHGASKSLNPVAIPNNSLAAVPNQVPVPKKAPIPSIRAAPTNAIVTNATNVPTDAPGTGTVNMVPPATHNKGSGADASKPRPAPPPAAKSTGTGAITSKPQPATPPAKKAPGAAASKPPAVAKFVALAKHAASAVPATYAAASPSHTLAKNAGKVMLYNDMDVNEESDGNWDPEAE